MNTILTISSSRWSLTRKISSKNKFSLSIGCGNTRFANINIDLNPQCSPDIVSDALHLPFKSGIFEQVFFMDVIEHLNKKYESKALKEINRILFQLGELILTTPHNKSLFTFLDPYRYLFGHRHYNKKEISDLLEVNGFKILNIFTSGGLWLCITLLYNLFILPLRKILNRPFLFIPYFMLKRINDEYNIAQEEGYTIFIKARKEIVVGLFLGLIPGGTRACAQLYRV